MVVAVETVMVLVMVVLMVVLMVVDYRPSSRSAGGTPWHWRAGC